MSITSNFEVNHMRRKRLKYPRSLPGTSAHPTMVTLVNIMVMHGWLTSFLFHVNRQSYSWVKAISNSDLETSRSRLWVWSKDTVMQSAQYPIYSLPFHFTSDQQYLRYSYFEIWPWNIQDQERERLSLSAFLVTEDIRVHIVHISRVIITYTLE